MNAVAEEEREGGNWEMGGNVEEGLKLSLLPFGPLLCSCCCYCYAHKVQFSNKRRKRANPFLSVVAVGGVAAAPAPATKL